MKTSVILLKIRLKKMIFYPKIFSIFSDLMEQVLMKKLRNICRNWTPTVLLCLLVLPGCNNSDKRATSGHFEKDISVRLKEAYESLGPIRDSLKLDSIDSGYDSLQIRIWTNVNHVQKVLVIKNNKGSWTASLINFGAVLDKYMDSVVGFRKDVSTVAPKSTWPEVTTRFFNDHILTLPDDGKLAGYEHSMDGWHVTVEVATVEKYRIYYYHDPEMNQGIPEAKSVMNILDLIKNEFDVTLLR
jgi:hypothetical protein